MFSPLNSRTQMVEGFPQTSDSQILRHANLNKSKELNSVCVNNWKWIIEMQLKHY